MNFPFSPLKRNPEKSFNGNGNGNHIQAQNSIKSPEVSYKYRREGEEE